MSEKAPESIFLKACHPASPNHNCTWSVNKGPEDSVEYVRADLLATRVKEARQEAFNAIGLELLKFGANIRKADFMARFQELFRELERAAATDKEK